MSDYFALEHMDSLEMGGTQFELHIHQGTETCAGCEPGQVQADIMASKKQGNINHSLVLLVRQILFSQTLLMLVLRIQYRDSGLDILLKANCITVVIQILALWTGLLQS